MTPQALKAILFRGAGYVFPAISIPVFAALLPSSEYGRLGVALTFCSILQALCEGGHTIAGARQLAVATTDIERREISLQAYSQRWLLFVVSAVIAVGYYSIRQMPLADWYVLAICMLGIVLADALVPTWIFHGTGALGTFGQVLFLSRAITFPLALLIIWSFPSAAGGALATCLPFIVIAIWSQRAARALCPSAVTSLRQTVFRPSFNGSQLNFHIGSILSTIFPALVMQVWAALNPSSNLGVAYLAIALWIACRQLAVLPIQSVFHLSAATSPDDHTKRSMERKARIVGLMIMVAASLVAGLLGPALLDTLKSGEYRLLPSIIWPMLLSGCLFIFANSILSAQLARGRSGHDFARIHAVSCLSFLVVCPVLHVIASPGSNWPLPGAVAIADSVLLCGALLMRPQESKHSRPVL